MVQHGNERLVLGYHFPDVATEAYKKQAQDVLDTLCSLLIAGGATAEPVADIELARWRKVLWHVSTH